MLGRKLRNLAKKIPSNMKLLQFRLETAIMLVITNFIVILKKFLNFPILINYSKFIDWKIRFDSITYLTEIGSQYPEHVCKDKCIIKYLDSFSKLITD